MGCGASTYLGCLSSTISPDSNYDPACIDKLTDAQLDEFREAFNMFDKDGSGSIDVSELNDLMISVGQTCTEEELKEMVKAADSDGTGDIDFLEFAVLMAHKMTDENKDDTLKKAFSVFDASGDGFISAQEMRKIMFKLGEDLEQEDVEAVMEEVDVDGDGQINYQEFAKILARDGETKAPVVRQATFGRLLVRALSQSLDLDSVRRRPSSKEVVIDSGSEGGSRRSKTDQRAPAPRSRSSSRENLKAVSTPTPRSRSSSRENLKALSKS